MINTNNCAKISTKSRKPIKIQSKTYGFDTRLNATIIIKVGVDRAMILLIEAAQNRITSQKLSSKPNKRKKSISYPTMISATSFL